MRKAYLITAIMLLSCAWVVAQNTSRPAPDTSQPSQQYPSSQQPDKSQTSAPSAAPSDHAAHSVEGCLGGSAGSYTLTDASGKTYQLGGDTSKLAEHVGHQVQISGTEDSSATSAGAGAPAMLNVKKVKMVSATCTNK